MTTEAVKILEAISTASTSFELKLKSYPFGGDAIDTVGEPLPAATLKACQEADAILMGERYIKSCVFVLHVKFY